MDFHFTEKNRSKCLDITAWLTNWTASGNKTPGISIISKELYILTTFLFFPQRAKIYFFLIFWIQLDSTVENVATFGYRGTRGEVSVNT